MIAGQIGGLVVGFKDKVYMVGQAQNGKWQAAKLRLRLMVFFSLLTAKFVAI